jgi:hypothetical protein
VNYLPGLIVEAGNDKKRVMGPGQAFSCNCLQTEPWRKQVGQMGVVMVEQDPGVLLYLLKPTSPASQLCDLG